MSIYRNQSCFECTPLEHLQNVIPEIDNEGTNVLTVLRSMACAVEEILRDLRRELLVGGSLANIDESLGHLHFILREDLRNSLAWKAGRRKLVELLLDDEILIPLIRGIATPRPDSVRSVA
jgi:hypothetical protein